MAAVAKPSASRPAARRAVLGLILFGIAFGFVEAAVVVYLRSLWQPYRAAAGLAANSLFPLQSLSRLGADARIVRIEVFREAATLIMLAAAAIPASKNARSWLAAFSLAFGVWDLCFYGWLVAMIGWPSSLFTWDILFLLPVPWAAPVLAPSIVALSLMIGGWVALLRDPPKVPFMSWLLMLLGAAVLLASFMWDWRHWVSGGLPRRFPWEIFALGELLGVAGFARALRPPSPPAETSSSPREISLADRDVASGLPDPL